MNANPKTYPRLNWFEIASDIITRPRETELSESDLEAALEAESHRLKTQQTGGERL